MKLEKNTIYRVDSQMKYEAMMNDCHAQGFYWNDPEDAKTHNTGKWNVYGKETCVRITDDGRLYYADVDYYKEYNPNQEIKNYVLSNNVVRQITPNCFAVDANSLKEAVDYMYKHICEVPDIGSINPSNVYTVRVDDKNTTVITPDGKVATAKCHPDDEFDVVEGFRVAMEKIKRQDIKLNQKEREILNAIVVLGGTSFYINDEHYLIADFDDESVYVSIEEDDFKWCEEYEDYNVKELLEQCS